jgi:hypothetical protein
MEQNGEFHYTIVRVLDQKILMDPSLGRRPYRARRPLMTGIYIVIWRRGEAVGHFTPDASYVGPFTKEIHARSWLDTFAEERESEGHTPPKRMNLS